jgi:hypothetical protein
VEGAQVGQHAVGLGLAVGGLGRQVDAAEAVAPVGLHAVQVAHQLAGIQVQRRTQPGGGIADVERIGQQEGRQHHAAQTQVQRGQGVVLGVEPFDLRVEILVAAEVGVLGAGHAALAHQLAGDRQVGIELDHRLDAEARVVAQVDGLADALGAAGLGAELQLVVVGRGGGHGAIAAHIHGDAIAEIGGLGGRERAGGQSDRVQGGVFFMGGSFRSSGCASGLLQGPGDEVVSEGYRRPLFRLDTKSTGFCPVFRENRANPRGCLDLEKFGRALAPPSKGML